MDSKKPETDLAKQIIGGYDALASDRSTFDNRLDDITFYVLPEYEAQNERTRDESNAPDRPSSSAATNAAILLGGHLFSHTVSTGEQWFTLRTPYPDDDDRELKEWLDVANKTALKAIQNSNFNEAYGEMCTLLGTYGTGVLATDFDDRRRELLFRNHPINGNVYLIEDARGRINGLYRLLRYTAQQAVERYGKENLPEEICSAAYDPSKIKERFDFIQHIGPNPDHNPELRTSEAMKYRSVHVYRDKEIEVKKEGFRTFPFACPRFIKVRDFAYGYGSGHLALPSIRELNKAEADFMDAYEMAAWPPMWVPDEEAVETSELEPRSVNYFNPALGGQPFQLRPNTDAGALYQRISQLEQRVSQQFFIDVFLAVSQRYAHQKTAREVDEISEEKLSSISPMVSRLQSECFTSLIERVVDILVTNGIIPEPPATLAGKDFRVVYTSRIDSKLAAIQVNETLRAYDEITTVREMVLRSEGAIERNADIDTTCQRILEKRNIDMDLILSKRDRQKMDVAAQQQMEREKQEAMSSQHTGKIDPMKKPEEGSMASQMADETVPPI
jgi:hypothetical protein